MSTTKTLNNLTLDIDLKNKLIADFETTGTTLFGSESAVISGKRNNAFLSFSKLGFPNKKNEEYKYTNIEAVLKKDFSTALTGHSSVNEIYFEPIVKSTVLLVLINGVYSEKHSRVNSLPAGVFAGSLAQGYLLKKDIVEKYFASSAASAPDGLIALNTALAKDGAFIYLPKGMVLETPIHIINVSSSGEISFVLQRNLIVLEQDAEAKIIESYQSSDLTANYFSNCLTEVIVGGQANLNHYRLQNESAHAFQVNTTQVHQNTNSSYNTYTFTLNGALVRNNLNIVLDDENIESHLFGLYLLNKNQHIDNHTLVDHRKPNCFSNELYKGIMDENSTGVFNGRIFVRQDAQKTNAFQSNKNILLSDDATINTKPQLEIYANDVKCSHGTSTGKIDEESLFYLRSRGIGESSARKLLMYAFAEEVVSTIKIKELRDYVEALIAKRFE